MSPTVCHILLSDFHLLSLPSSVHKLDTWEALRLHRQETKARVQRRTCVGPHFTGVSSCLSSRTGA